MSLLIRSHGNCAWLDCRVEDSLVFRAVDTKKLLRLPTCPQHFAPIKNLRKIYKKSADLSEKWYDKLELARQDRAKKLKILQNLEESLKLEIQARLKQAETIKEEYHNAGHLFIIKKLMQDLEKVAAEIRELNTTN